MISRQKLEISFLSLNHCERAAGNAYKYIKFIMCNGAEFITVILKILKKKVDILKGGALYDRALALEAIPRMNFCQIRHVFTNFARKLSTCRKMLR